MLWLAASLNSKQSNVYCCYINGVSNIERTVQRRILMRTQKPKGLSFLANVGKRNRTTYLGNNNQQGNHWSMCHVDSQRKLIIYDDSFGWAMPSELVVKVRLFIDAVYGEKESETYTTWACHDPESRSWSGNHCSDQCAASFPYRDALIYVVW